MKKSPIIEKSVSEAEFDRISNKFPNVKVRSFQASGSTPHFYVKWTRGEKKPFDLVREFVAIF